MSADRIYVSERSAADAGRKAVKLRKADDFRILPRIQRNPDRSIERGFAALLKIRGRSVGYA